MAHLLSPLLLLQRFIVPAIWVILLWAAWRLAFRKDAAIGLALYIALVVLIDAFYNTGIYLPGLEQGSIRYSEVCAGFLLLTPRPPGDATPIRRTVLTMVVLYFALLFAAAVRAQPMLSGIMEFRKIAFPQIVAFTLAIRGFTQPTDYRRFLLGVTALVMIVGLFSLWDVLFDRWILHSDMLYKQEYWMNRKNGRFGSVFLNPNFLGAFVVITFSPLFVLLLDERIHRVRVYLGVVLLALIFCLVETQSRAPLLAFGGSVFMLALGPVGSVSRRKRIGGLVGVLIILLLVMPGFFEHASERFGSIDNEMTKESVSRASVWEYTRGIITDHPFGGIGFGEQQFLAAMDKTDFKSRFGRESLDNPHNSYLQAAVYAGIPALVAFLAANLTLLWAAMRTVRRERTRGPSSAAVFGAAVGIAGFLLSIYPDMHLFTANVGPLYWLLFGLLLSAVSAKSATDGELTDSGPSRRYPTDVADPLGQRRGRRATRRRPGFPPQPLRRWRNTPSAY